MFGICSTVGHVGDGPGTGAGQADEHSGCPVWPSVKDFLAFNGQGHRGALQSVAQGFVLKWMGWRQLDRASSG